MVNAEPETIKAPGPLTVISKGRTLIVDTEAGRALACAKRLSDHRLTCTLVITKKPSLEAPFSRPGRPALLEAEDLIDYRRTWRFFGHRDGKKGIKRI